MKKKCKFCGNLVDFDATFCPKCDSDLVDDDYIKKMGYKKNIKRFLIIAVIAFIAWYIIMSMPYSTEVKISPANKIKISMSYKPFSRCVEAKATYMIYTRTKQRCDVSYSEYLQLRNNADNNFKMFESLFNKYNK